MIDFHCHLDLFPDYQRVVDDCMGANIYILAVTTTPSAWRGTRKLVCASRRIRVALGLHPELAHRRESELGLFEEHLRDAQYVGEVGLDGSKHLHSSQDAQLRVFRSVLWLTQRAGGRVMSIHSRHAVDPVLDLLKAHDAGIPVLHWFSGSKTQLKRAADMGCWFSVGPAMLRSRKGRDLVSAMPRERVLTETDGPFTRLGGKPLLPFDVSRAVPELGAIWGEAEHLVEARLIDSFKRLLRLAADCREGSRSVA